MAVNKIAPYWSCLFAALTCGCATDSVRLYPGPERSRETVAFLAAQSNVFDVTTALTTVIAIDGVRHRAIRVGYELAPGEYSVDLLVTAPDRREATINTRLRAEAGHTYIPASLVQGDHAYARIKDEGQNFPIECLPAHIFAANSDGLVPRSQRLERKCPLKSVPGSNRM